MTSECFADSKIGTVFKGGNLLPDFTQKEFKNAHFQTVYPNQIKMHGYLVLIHNLSNRLKTLNQYQLSKLYMYASSSFAPDELSLCGTHALTHSFMVMPESWTGILILLLYNTLSATTSNIILFLQSSIQDQISS